MLFFKIDLVTLFLDFLLKFKTRNLTDRMPLSFNAAGDAGRRR